jgi:hypothetical protein
MLTMTVARRRTRLDYGGNMGNAGFLPTTDAGLLAWANAFSDQVTASAVAFGLDSSLASSFATITASYQSAYDEATNESTRTKGTVANKNTQKQLLRDEAMMLAALVQAHPGITAQQLADLGLTVRDKEPSPVPPPAQAPVVTVLSVTGRVVRYKMADATSPSSRARPANATGCLVLSYAGETPPPANDPGWRLEGVTGRTTVSVQFPSTVEPGTKCWITAMWMNARGQFSPACDPVQTYLQIGPAAEAA